MKKIKGLLFAFVALFAFTLALVTVNATEAQYGTYDVSEQGKKAVWNFTTNVPSSNVTVNNLTSQALFGIGGDSTKGVTFKSADSKISNNTSGTIYVPMPSSDAAGTITLVGNRSGDRNVTVNGVADNKIADNKDGASYTFTASELSEETVGADTKYYLKLTPGTGEVKIGKITVVLTTGAYPMTAAKITVTLKDTSDKVLRTDATVEIGSAYEKGYATWGYDTTGYFLDKALTQAYDGTALTADTTLYVGLEAWDGVITNPNNLTNELVGKLDGVELSGAYPLTGTIYTLLSSTSYATTNETPCIGTGGAVSKTEKGVKLDVATDGVLKVTLTTAGTSARNAKVINASSGSAVTVADGDVAWTAAQATAYEVRTLTYNLEAGSYCVGGDNGMRIISLSFTTGDPEPTSDMNAYMGAGVNAQGTEVVRFILKCDYVPEDVIRSYFEEGNMRVIVKAEGLPEEGLDITEYGVIASRITKDGQTYSVEDENGDIIEFGTVENTLYVVWVVAVANDGADLTNQWAGVELTAELQGQDNGWKTWTTWTYTVVGDQQ